MLELELRQGLERIELVVAEGLVRRLPHIIRGHVPKAPVVRFHIGTLAPRGLNAGEPHACRLADQGTSTSARWSATFWQAAPSAANSFEVS